MGIQPVFSNFCTSIDQAPLPQGFAVAKISAVTPGERFKALRKKAGYGQRGLAQAIGLKSDQAVSNFEIGTSKSMHPDNWRRAAEVFGITPAELDLVVFGRPPFPVPADPLEADLRARVAPDALAEMERAAATIGMSLSEFIAFALKVAREKAAQQSPAAKPAPAADVAGKITPPAPTPAHRGRPKLSEAARSKPGESGDQVKTPRDDRKK